MAFNPDHARRISALERSNRVVQVGVQSVSGKAITRAREFSTPGRLGTITAVHTHHYRNRPYGGWKRTIRLTVIWKTSVGKSSRAKCSSRFRSTTVHQLAIFLGLSRWKRLRKHGPPVSVLVQGAGTQDTAPRHHDRLVQIVRAGLTSGNLKLCRGFLDTSQFDSHPVAAVDRAKDLTATASSSLMSKTVYSLVICIRS
jgi:hypothetical protein